MIDHDLKFFKMQLLVKSISLWRQQTKNFEINKILNFRILRDLDLPIKIRLQERKVWCLANNLREKQKNLYGWIQIKQKYI